MNPFEEILEKARHYCAYRERSPKEVRDKLKLWKLKEDDIRKVMNSLKEDDFLNESRFARAFVMGKLRNNGWGKFKIRYELMGKGMGEDTIEKALNEIDADEYDRVLKDLIIRKSRDIKDTDPYIRKGKIIKYLNGKGFSYEEINKVLQ